MAENPSRVVWIFVILLSRITISNETRKRNQNQWQTEMCGTDKRKCVALTLLLLDTVVAASDAGNIYNPPESYLK